ncbi:efflux RND transporter periplasmic adaptor subunit [Pollutibacter soli]|uniref:efflux RND transporter periplasmic adaptor subunit n=1 Tax=Pollutibacter soli TaxID=3034157 RepID=UPI003013FCA3
MKKISLITALFFLMACGASTADKNKGGINEKKASLESFKKQKEELDKKILALEAEIAKLDPSTVEEKAKLVSISEIQPQDFQHFIDLQGKITTENTYNVSPRGQGGQVKAIYVKLGDRVKKGQLLLKLDDAVVRQNIAQLETQVSFAKSIFERQKNLWNEGIGTEVQYLTAKNNVENLEKQMAVVKEQLNLSNVYAEVSGVAESVNIRVGEFFSGAPMAGITIVNPSALKAVVDVPENYVAKIKKGMPVIVEVPDLNKKYKTSINLVSETINNISRSFVAEAKVPADNILKPNQVAVVKILDHQAKNAVVIPVEIVQTDENGKYIYVVGEEKGKKVAKKKPVTIGEFYSDLIEVKSGIAAGDKIITRGFQGLYENQVLELAAN